MWKRTARFTAALGALALVVSACTSDNDTPGEDEGSVDATGEAPMLAELVDAGSLPPVGERLPGEPMVVEPVEELGTYGGTWETAMLGPGDTNQTRLTMGYQGIVRWAANWTGALGDEEVLPNVAASYDVNDDGTEYTFTLREGMKWSDGEPFTVDDIVFAYEDVQLNSELNPSTNPAFVSEGEPATLRVDDENTVTFVFEHPHGMFLQLLASNDTLLISPKHYMRQFHPDYNDDLDTVVANEGFETWVDLFNDKGGWDALARNAELPVVNPWVVTTPLGEGQRIVAERNPYYWKVDPEGNQLPYLDGVSYEVIEDAEVMLAGALQGDFDMHVRHFNTAANKPVLADAREDGDFDFFDAIPSSMNTMVLNFNLTHKNEVLREIFNNKDFRIGLSHAIDRQTLIDTVYQRQGEPWQSAPRPESPLYDEDMAKQYTEFDVELANELLDKAGYTERDSSGMRLGPDGEPISFRADYATGINPTWADALDLISRNFAEVGIEMTPDPMERSLLEERRVANQSDVVIWNAGGGLDVALNPFWYAPVGDRADYAQLWQQWYTSGGEQGEEPPEATKQQFELYDQMLATADAEGQADLMRQILEIAKDEFYTIGTVLPAMEYGIVKNTFGNVPDVMPLSSWYPTPAPTNPDQYFKSPG